MSLVCIEPPVTLRSRCPAVVRSSRRVRRAHQPTVERQDINFYNVAADRVRVEITVRNLSPVESAPTFLELEFAEFGAFLPWHPLARLSVPLIAAHGRTVVVTEVEQARLEDRVDGPHEPARHPRIATGAEEPRRPSERGNNLGSLAQVMANWRALRGPRGLLWGADPMSRRSTHWIGNINVFVGRAPVERHLARALRVYPGRTNVAMFNVGTRNDEYSFACEGLPMALYATLLLLDYYSGFEPISVASSSDSGKEAQAWLKIKPFSPIYLSLELPADCDAGELAVHVRRRSDRREAVVEFSLDAAADGPGCYVVGG